MIRCVKVLLYLIKWRLNVIVCSINQENIVNLVFYLKLALYFIEFNFRLADNCNIMKNDSIECQIFKDNFKQHYNYLIPHCPKTFLCLF